MDRKATRTAVERFRDIIKKSTRMFFGSQSNASPAVCNVGKYDQQRLDRPGKVANPARDLLNRNSEFSPVPVRV